MIFIRFILKFNIIFSKRLSRPVSTRSSDITRQGERKRTANIDRFQCCADKILTDCEKTGFHPFRATGLIFVFILVFIQNHRFLIPKRPASVSQGSHAVPWCPVMTRARPRPGLRGFRATREMKAKMKTKIRKIPYFPRISNFWLQFLSSFSASGAPAGGFEVGGRRNPAREVPEPTAGPQDAPWDHSLHALAPATLKTKMKTKITKSLIVVFKTRFLKNPSLIFKISL